MAKSTIGKRNRTAGHNWEREIVNKLIAAGYIHAVTSRSESRSKDAKKIDICNKDEIVNGRLPFNIQAKSCTGSIPYIKLLSQIPKDGNINMIFHRYTKKSPAGKFITEGHYAFLNYSDLMALLAAKLRLDTIESNTASSTIVALQKQLENKDKVIGILMEALPESELTRIKKILEELNL